jgi:16S rRNA A1518/A1519 N6-dimethyltransferase RsmA/KsgA/DIM1 with predicted DNA glycosylase/AP lyase activity
MRTRDEVDELMAAHDIDPRRRGETLSVDEFIKLAQAIRESGLLTTQN